MPDTGTQASKARRSSRLFRIVTGIVVAAACLWLAFRGVDLGRLSAILTQASPWPIAAAVLIAILTSAVKCTKLGILLQSVRKVPFRTLYAAEMISVLVDIVFPLRLHELVKAYVVGRGGKIPPSLVLGAEVVEKSMDFSFLVGLFVIFSFLHPLPWWLTSWIWIGVAVVGAMFLFFRLVISHPGASDRIVRRFGSLPIWGGRIRGILENMARGIRQAALRPSTLGKVLMITLLEWGLLAATLWVASLAVGHALSAPQLMGVLAANFVAFAIPTSTSGSVGIYELAGTMTLVLLFGMAREKALSLVLIFHAVMIGSGALAGVVGLHLAHLSLSQIRKEAES